jgi:hypothetical protein
MSKWGFILLAGMAVSTSAQFSLPANDAGRVERALNQGLKGDPLNCEARPLKPFLDFAFRFEVGYIVQCGLQQFGGNEEGLVSYVRVRPAEGQSVILAEIYRVPAIPESMRTRVNLKKLRVAIEFSGVFAVGEGEYLVDLIVTDKHNRIFRKNWKSKASAHGKEQQASTALKPNSAGPITFPSWSSKTADGDSPLRLTVLLNAAPVNPYALKLRAWDRAFLLDSLSSLLRQIPDASVKLVAFNLDQQREIYRTDEFSRSELRKLSKALADLELGTVSYRTLQKTQGWSELLVKLVKEQAAAERPSNAVIFLGPHTRIAEKVPKEILQPCEGTNPAFFYLEYFPIQGADFSDTIQYVTSACSGTTFKLHSPGELADSIGKLQKKLARGGEDDGSAR